jgi:hypothetical protein
MSVFRNLTGHDSSLAGFFPVFNVLGTLIYKPVPWEAFIIIIVERILVLLSSCRFSFLSFSSGQCKVARPQTDNEPFKIRDGVV